MTTPERKSLLRLLSGRTLDRQPRQRQRGATYNHRLDDALRELAETLDYDCAEWLKPALSELAKQLAAHGELELTSELLKQLKSAIVSMVRRHLAGLAQDQPRLPRACPMDIGRPKSKRAFSAERYILRRTRWAWVRRGSLFTTTT